MRRNDGNWEEDIQCIIEPHQGVGGIYISNIEAASNPRTLARTTFPTQDTGLAQ